jgi:hypothetical protein
MEWELLFHTAGVKQMPKTALGLFESPDRATKVIKDIEAIGIPRNEIRTLAEPDTFEIDSAKSFPRLDYEVDLQMELNRLGATKEEIDAYIDGLHRGGVLVLATGPDGDQKVDAAAEAMNREGAIGIEEKVSTSGPNLPRVRHQGMQLGDDQESAGRVRQSGAGVFVW